MSRALDRGQQPISPSALGTGTPDGTKFLRDDGTWQTISTTPTTDQVLTATAGASVGAVGTYAWLAQSAGTTTAITAGTTYAGSGLRYFGYRSSSLADETAIAAAGVGATPSGTWRAMGSAPSTVSVLRHTLFLRIS